MQTIYLNASDNMTQPAIKKLIHSLADAYECLTGAEQELANEIFGLMNRLEDIGFEQNEAGFEEFKEQVESTVGHE